MEVVLMLLAAVAKGLGQGMGKEIIKSIIDNEKNNLATKEDIARAVYQIMHHIDQAVEQQLHFLTFSKIREARELLIAFAGDDDRAIKGSYEKHHIEAADRAAIEAYAKLEELTAVAEPSLYILSYSRLAAIHIAVAAAGFQHYRTNSTKRRLEAVVKIYTDELSNCVVSGRRYEEEKIEDTLFNHRPVRWDDDDLPKFVLDLMEKESRYSEIMRPMRLRYNPTEAQGYFFVTSKRARKGPIVGTWHYRHYYEDAITAARQEMEPRRAQEIALADNRKEIREREIFLPIEVYVAQITKLVRNSRIIAP